MGKGSGQTVRASLTVQECTTERESEASLEDAVYASANFKASRSSGPGGQHANSSSSRIEASLCVDELSVSPEMQSRLQERYGHTIRAVSQDHRGQAANRQAALGRLIAKVHAGLIVAPPRKETRPSKTVKEKAAQAKKQHSQKKRERAYRPES